MIPLFLDLYPDATQAELEAIQADHDRQIRAQRYRQWHKEVYGEWPDWDEEDGE